MNGPHLLRPVALVGMPGSGKTAVGHLLADRLALPFADSDAEIEAETGEAIASIFARHGETHFRELEHQIIGRLLAARSIVLATGGGAMAQSATRRLLLARATTIWLDVPADILATRLAGQTHRPLLAGDDLPAAVATLAARRERHYSRADHRIAANTDAGALVARILALIRP